MGKTECIDYINLWLEHRGYEHEYIFTTKYNGGVKMASKECVNGICSDILSDILGRRINPHLFKASAATNLLSKGKDIKLVSKYVCQHNDISTTQKFYDLRPDEGMDNLFD